MNIVGELNFIHSKLKKKKKNREKSAFVLIFQIFTLRRLTYYFWQQMVERKLFLYAVYSNNIRFKSLVHP